MPGPPLGPSYRITSTSPSLYFFFLTASKHASSPSKQRAGPVNFKSAIPATFTIAPSGARLPLSPTTPPLAESGLSAGGGPAPALFPLPLLWFSALGPPPPG